MFSARLVTMNERLEKGLKETMALYTYQRRTTHGYGPSSVIMKAELVNLFIKAYPAS
jgi:hypothetical protein